jgi:hypothetical protein
MKGPLSFLGDLKATALMEHFGAELHVPTRTPGAYILVAREGIDFKYPRGDSPVYYIGKAGGPEHGLRNRLRQHKNKILEARHNPKFSIYPPREQYGAAFGKYFSYVTTKDAEIDPAELEIQLMARFAMKYGSLPVANSVAEWAKIRSAIELCGTNIQT